MTDPPRPAAYPEGLPASLRAARDSLSDEWQWVTEWGALTQLDELCDLGLAECRVTRRLGGDTGTEHFYRRAHKSALTTP